MNHDNALYISNCYIISDLRQVSVFLWVLQFSPTNKTDLYEITEILLKVV